MEITTVLTKYRSAYVSGLAEARANGDDIDIYANAEVLRVIEAIAKEIGVEITT